MKINIEDLRERVRVLTNQAIEENKYQELNKELKNNLNYILDLIVIKNSDLVCLERKKMDLEKVIYDPDKSLKYFNNIENLKDIFIESASYTNTNLTLNFKGNFKSKFFVEYYAFGDCCSESTIDSVDFIDYFKNCVLYKVTTESGETESEGCVQWTFYKFYTSNGVVTLSFRNESNGYYGGSLVLSKVVYEGSRY